MSTLQPARLLAAQAVWPVDRVKDHASKIGSGVTPTGGAAAYLDTGVPLLRSQNVHFDGLRLDDVAYIGEDTHDEMGGSKLRPRDVLLNITGASIGRCAYVPEDFGEGNVNQHVCIIRPAAKLNHKFLTYCLSAPWGQDQVFAGFTGASRQGLGQRDLGEIQVPLPPLPEQQRIATYLDASCAAIDAAVAAKRSQLDTLDALRKSIIQRAVTFGIEANPKLRQVNSDWIREVPSHWDVCRVKRVVARMDYGIGVSTGDEGRYPVLKMGNVQDGEIQFAKLDFIDEVDDNLILERGDLLYNRTNSPDQVGKAAIFRKSRADAITFASYLVRLRVNHRVNAWYLNYVLNTSGFLAFARRLAVPSVQQSNLNSTRYAQMFIPLPPIEEQKAILSFLNEKTAAVDTVVATIQTQIETLTAYRKSLIHECVTGQRRVTEADVAAIA
ncbi:restriction endonuclease subunit S [Acidovorax sp.]|jgi:type I restriction enzyme S subunit|uniref:restriction endonuclease subunit S n=1 Tax=Acidovorax sp. TaxID=1872122 RepID=UPI0025C0FF00|nr:restriction endonuclease subunit S [Acidovorax sp.]